VHSEGDRTKSSERRNVFQIKKTRRQGKQCLNRRVIAWETSPGPYEKTGAKVKTVTWTSGKDERGKASIWGFEQRGSDLRKGVWPLGEIIKVTWNRNLKKKKKKKKKKKTKKKKHPKKKKKPNLRAVKLLKNGPIASKGALPRRIE